jgi:hypothetical protein
MHIVPSRIAQKKKGDKFGKIINKTVKEVISDDIAGRYSTFLPNRRGSQMGTFRIDGTLRRVLVTIVAVETQQALQILSVCL